MITHPVSVYINWAAYDELSDNVELTEALALRQLDELIRLRKQGVRFDYYMMDAFWYAADGAYRTFRTPHWPNGPDAWLARCREAGVKPGLWVTANALCKMECPPAWRDSFDERQQAFCCFSGGFLSDYMAALSAWYARGIRAFKFDFANFTAAPERLHRVLLPSEIRSANLVAWQGMMKAFRSEHPDVLLMAYNGFEEWYLQANTGVPCRKTMDARWLDVFDSVYCGDPRPADVPAMAFWRSKDVYSDHMVRVYEANGVPLARIDNSGFMVGTTGTCYHRGTAAWKGMLVLSLARGGWVNTYYGNLDLLDAEKAAWFARVQGLFLDLQESGRFSTFGGLPGEAAPYGFSARRGDRGLLTVVNPGQLTADVPLPATGSPLRVLFHDSGFVPKLENGAIRLGPEQLALVGVGAYAGAAFDLGVQEDVRIPRESRLLAEFSGQPNERRLARVIEAPPAAGRLRFVLRQREAAGPLRSTGGAPPSGVPLGRLLRLGAEQAGRPVPVAIAYDKAIWSGLSWAVGEVECAALAPGAPLALAGETADSRPLTLQGAVYHVTD